MNTLKTKKMEVIKRIVSLSNAERSVDDKGFWFDISDETPDAHKTVFRIDGWENPERFASPVTYGHPDLDDPDPDNASIAMSDVTIDKKKRVMRAYIGDDQWDEGEPINPSRKAVITETPFIPLVESPLKWNIFWDKITLSPVSVLMT